MNIPFVPGEEPERGFRFGDERERIVYSRLAQLIGSGPAAFFKDTCILMQTPPPELETKAHLVGHCVREVEGSIRDTLQVLVISGESPRPKRKRKGQERSCDDKEDHRKDGHRAVIEQILATFGVKATDDLATHWVALVTGKASLARDAHRDGLRPPRTPGEELHIRWSHLVSIFDRVLDLAEANFSKYKSVIDAAINENTRKRRVAILRELPHTEVIQGYLFNAVESPDWIEVFEEARYFQHPPRPNREGSIVRYPVWSASAYLSRMAVDAPDQVARVVRIIPIPENPVVHADLINAACHFRLEALGTLPERELEWIQGQQSLHHYEERAIMQFVKHLIQLGHPQGVAILEAFVRPVAETRAGDAGRNHLPIPPEPKGLVEAWEFGERMEEDVLPLVEKLGHAGLELFTRTLDRAMRISQGERDVGFEDYSYIWRQALDGESSRRNSYRDVIIDTIIAYTARQIELDAKAAEPAVKTCLAHPWPIHRRLALHLMRKHLGTLHEYAVATLRRPEVLLDDRLRHEVYGLLHEIFPRLNDDKKDLILKTLTTEGSETEVASGGAERQRDLFEAIAGELPAPWQDYYKELAANQPASAHPDYYSYSDRVTWSGPESPLSEAELESIPLADLLQYFKRWEPIRQWHAPSRDGLGHVLTRVVSRNPKPYAEHANAFKELDVEYTNALLGGLDNATRSGLQFEWHAPIELLQWVVEQDASILHPRHCGGEGYPLWSWTITSAARLISAATQKKQLPPEHWEATIRVLEAILQNDHLLEREQEWRQSQDTYLNQAINMPRGIALQALINLGVLIASSQAGAPPESMGSAGDARLKRSVMALLTRHLNDASGHSLALRAVYGASLGQLLYADKGWVNRHRDDLFNAEGESEHRGRASWQAFITYLPPRVPFLHALREYYQHAVERRER